MKISIITVSFNAADTIKDTLCSVANQTHDDIEHILIDGASTDETLDIVKVYGKHLAHVTSEPDKGLYDAMNKGISLATGDVIGLLNADDLYEDDTILAKVAEDMLSKNLDALYGDVTFFEGNNPKQIRRRYRSNYFSPERIPWGWMPAHPTLFLQRAIYEKIGPFKTDYQIAGDFEFIARAFYGKNLHYHYRPEVFVKMRIGGISTGGWKNSIILNQEVLRACHDNGIQTNIFKILSKYPRKILEIFSTK